MILPPAVVLGAHLLMPVSDSVPTLNVNQVCTGIAQQGGVSFHDTDTSEAKKNCLDSEQSTRDQLVKEWSSFSPSDKTSCTNEARMGGDSSYTELITCLEMARDVRNLKNDADTAGQSAAPSLAAPAPKAAPFVPLVTPAAPAVTPTPARPSQQ